MALITGVPTLAGNFQVTLTASNLRGTGASVLNILVLNTGSSVVQEIWTNVPGINVTDIPDRTPANITNVLGTLEGITNYGDNYGERIRGYFTAPVTGNYYFWIAGSDSAQLWISDDNNQVNEVLRAWVTPTNNPTAPGQNGTAPRPMEFAGVASNPAGFRWWRGSNITLKFCTRRASARDDNWSVGWLQDPTGTNITPAGVCAGLSVVALLSAAAGQQSRARFTRPTCSHCPESPAKASARPRCASMPPARRPR